MFYVCCRNAQLFDELSSHLLFSFQMKVFTYNYALFPSMLSWKTLSWDIFNLSSFHHSKWLTMYYLQHHDGDVVTHSGNESKEGYILKWLQLTLFCHLQTKVTGDRTCEKKDYGMSVSHHSLNPMAINFKEWLNFKWETSNNVSSF